MQIEREGRGVQFHQEPKKLQDKKPQSSFEQKWIEFMQEVITRGAFSRPHGARYKVWLRQEDIITSRLKGESIESISQRFKKPVRWVTAQLRYGSEKVYDDSPEELRQRYPRESLFPKRSEIIRLRRKERDMTLAVQLQREDLNKEELQELMAKVGYNFYRRHKGLFIEVLKMAKDVGFKRPSVVNLDLIVDVLEKDGGVVVGACHRSGGKMLILLKQDYEAAREILELSEKLSHLLEGD